MKKFNSVDPTSKCLSRISETISEDQNTPCMLPPQNKYIHVKGGTDNVIQRLLNCNIVKEQLTRNHKINDTKIKIATDKNHVRGATSGLNHHGLDSNNTYDRMEYMVKNRP
jgi:hypothetical protein